MSFVLSTRNTVRLTAADHAAINQVEINLVTAEEDFTGFCESLPGNDGNLWSKDQGAEFMRHHETVNQWHVKLANAKHPGVLTISNVDLNTITAMMHHLGMLGDSTAPAFATDADLSTELFGTNCENQQLTDEQEQQLRAERCIQRYLTQLDHGGVDQMVIPTHKVQTGAGWIITPDEIHGSLKIWMLEIINRTDLYNTLFEVFPNSQDLWHKWTSFLRRAVTHGGFQICTSMR